MKKTRRLTALFLSLALAIALSACGGGGGSAETPSGGDDPSGETGGQVSASGEYDLTGVEPITIVASSALSTTHCCWEGFYQPFMERVEELSGGLVTFEYYVGAELVDGGKEYDALRDGVCDVAMPLTPVYDTSRFPRRRRAAAALQELHLPAVLRRLCGHAGERRDHRRRQDLL